MAGATRSNEPTWNPRRLPAAMVSSVLAAPARARSGEALLRLTCLEFFAAHGHWLLTVRYRPRQGQSEGLMDRAVSGSEGGCLGGDPALERQLQHLREK